MLSTAQHSPHMGQVVKLRKSKASKVQSTSLMRQLEKAAPAISVLHPSDGKDRGLTP